MGELNSKHNRAVWFDIPVKDLDRAAKFYEAVLAIQVLRETSGGVEFGVLEHSEGNGGCLIVNASEVGVSGVVLYLNVDGRIRDAESKVVPHGGTVLKPAHAIGPHGFAALVLDSEGNRVALHSNSDA